MTVERNDDDDDEEEKYIYTYMCAHTIVYYSALRRGNYAIWWQVNGTGGYHSE